MSSTGKQQVSKWFCDKCNVAYFDDYTEACAHESKCNGTPLPEFARFVEEQNKSRRTGNCSIGPVTSIPHSDNVDSSDDEEGCKKAMIDQSKSLNTASIGLATTGNPTIRDTLNGIWLLDKSLSSSMRGYFEIMSISEEIIHRHLQIEANKTAVNDITLTHDGYRLKHFLLESTDEAQVFSLPLNSEETISISRPKEKNDRKKTTLMRSTLGLDTVKVTCSIDTIHGFKALVTDKKSLIKVQTYNHSVRKEESKPACTWLPEESTLMKHELRVFNESTGENHTTTRYFLPFDYPKGDFNSVEADT